MWSKKRHSVTFTPRSLKRPAQLFKRRVSCLEKAANIKVVVRVRPRDNRDIGCRQVVQVVSECCLVFDPKEGNDEFYVGGHKQLNRDMLKKRNKNLEFQFDRVFDEDSSNCDLFEETTQDLICSLLDGFNCSVFVYGATGAGKTYTMLGKKDSPGIAYLTMVELYKKMDEKADDFKFNLNMSYIEVYNENVKDLISPSGPLSVLDDGKDGVIISGIKMHPIETADELFAMLECGNRNRTQHPTDANAESSRSHAVFQVHLSVTHKISMETKISKLTMIDLAGSERGAATGGRGVRFSEGSNINKSLLALGNCVDALAEGHKHVPYRNSKLTRILKDSLGGNCKTVMIVNVSPSSISYEETFNTLNYASRAKKISNKVRKNLLNVDMTVAQYKKVIGELKDKNFALENEIKCLKESKVVPSEGNQNTQNTTDIHKAKEVLRCLYELEGKYSAEMLMYQIKKKTLDWRIYQKKMISERFRLFEYMLLDTKSQARRDEAMCNFKMQRRVFKDKVKSLQKLLKEKQTLRDVALKEIETKGLAANLQKDIDYYSSKIKEENMLLQVKYYKDLLLKQQQEMSNSDRSINNLCKSMDYYYSILHGSGKITEEMKEEYLAHVQQLAGVKGVSWEDEPCEYTILRKIMDLSFISEDSKSSVASHSDGINSEFALDNVLSVEETVGMTPVQSRSEESPVQVPSTLTEVEKIISFQNPDVYMRAEENQLEHPSLTDFSTPNKSGKSDFDKTFAVDTSPQNQFPSEKNSKTSLETVPEEPSSCKGYDRCTGIANTTFDSLEMNDNKCTEEFEGNPESVSALNSTFTKDDVSSEVRNCVQNITPHSEDVKNVYGCSNKTISSPVVRIKQSLVKSSLPIVRSVSSSSVNIGPKSVPGSTNCDYRTPTMCSKLISGSSHRNNTGNTSSILKKKCNAPASLAKVKLSTHDRFNVRPGTAIKVQYVLADKNKLFSDLPKDDFKQKSSVTKKLSHMKENRIIPAMKKDSPRYPTKVFYNKITYDKFHGSSGKTRMEQID